jgi:hypothetical protein
MSIGESAVLGAFLAAGEFLRPCDFRVSAEPAPMLASSGASLRMTRVLQPSIKSLWTTRATSCVADDGFAPRTTRPAADALKAQRGRATKFLRIGSPRFDAVGLADGDTSGPVTGMGK